MAFEKDRVLLRHDIKYHQLTRHYSASRRVLSGQCVFEGIIVTVQNQTEDVVLTLNLFDDIVAAGSRLCPPDLIKVFVAGADNYFTLSYDPPIICWKGVYVQIASAGGGLVRYQVVYDR